MEPDFFDICYYLATEEDALQFCRERGLVPAPPGNTSSVAAAATEYWGVCGELRLNPAVPDCKGKVTTRWRVFANGPKPQFHCSRCKKQVSQQRGLKLSSSDTYRGTFFSSTDILGKPNGKVSKAAVLWILYCMVHKMSIAATVSCAANRFSDISANTVLDWRSYARELFSLALRDAPAMGGVGQSVHIDVLPYVSRDREEKMASRRHSSRLVEGPWLFGIMHRATYEFRLFFAQRRDEATLLPIISRHVAAGTTVVSDTWSGYRFVAAPRGVGGSPCYDHRPVAAQPQKLTCAWRKVRKSLSTMSKSVCPPHLPGHLARLWWESQVGREPFNRLLELIRTHYPQQ